MKIYLANLQAYNEGRLSGKWLDITKDDLQQAVIDLDGAEWAIHDYELPFKIGEHEDLYELEKVGKIWNSMSDYEQAAFCCLVDWCGDSLSQALESYNSRSVYVAESFEDLAKQLVEDGLYGEIPESVSWYINYKQIGYELEYNYLKYEYKNTIYFISYN